MIRPQTCPICREELPPELGFDTPHFPFCSKRCQQVDLLRWSDGRYAIVDPLSDDELQEALGEDESEDEEA